MEQWWERREQQREAEEHLSPKNKGKEMAEEEVESRGCLLQEREGRGRERVRLSRRSDNKPEKNRERGRGRERQRRREDWREKPENKRERGERQGRDDMKEEKPEKKKGREAEDER